jgi:sRNA-binding carbon storage regulator CsrA
LGGFLAEGKTEKRLDSSSSVGALGVTLYQGEWIDIGDNIRVIFKKNRGSLACALTVIAPKEVRVRRSNAKDRDANGDGS